jgi:hypothetical protein
VERIGDLQQGGDEERSASALTTFNGIGIMAPMTGSSVAPAVTVLLIIPLAFWIFPAIPAFVIGRRLGLAHPGEAFIPLVGPSIVLLRSIDRSGWMSILGLIPYAGLIFFIWLACVIPGEHGRTKWWILPFLIPLVNFVAFYVYAFTLTRDETASEPFVSAT